MYRVEIDRQITDLSVYRDIFHELCELPHSEPSQSPEWQGALARSHVREQDELLLVRLVSDNTVCALVPFVARTERLFGVPFVTLHPLAEFYNTHSDILMRYRSPGLTHALLEALCAMEPGWDVLRIKRMLEDNPLVEHFRSYAQDHRLQHRIQYALPSFYTPLTGSFDEYFSGRSGKFRNYIRRKERQIHGLGEIKILENDGTRAFEELYRDVMQIEKGSWKHEHGTAISSIQRQKEFYHEYCLAADSSGGLHLMLMYLDDRPIAYNMGIIKDRTYYYLKTSFCEQYRKSSPASILRIQLVRLLCQRGMEVFDFPGEPYEWESQWADNVRWHQSITLYNRNIRSRMLAALSRVRNWGRRQAGRKLEYVDPRDLKAPASRK